MIGQKIMGSKVITALYRKRAAKMNKIAANIFMVILYALFLKKFFDLSASKAITTLDPTSIT
jgi:uncharacterized membrane-anchored protein